MGVLGNPYPGRSPSRGLALPRREAPKSLRDRRDRRPAPGLRAPMPPPGTRRRHQEGNEDSDGGGASLVGRARPVLVVVLVEEGRAATVAGAPGRGDAAARSGLLVGCGDLVAARPGGVRLTGPGRAPRLRIADLDPAPGTRGDGSGDVGRQRHRDGLPAVALGGSALALLVHPLRMVGLLDQRTPRPPGETVGAGADAPPGSSSGSAGAEDAGWCLRVWFSRSRCAATSARRRSIVKTNRRRS